MKAVFFDVDGTLIDCVEKKIPASSIKAIEELRKNGYKVALATGRDINSIRGIKDLDISIFDAYVLNNGAAIYDNTLRCIKDFPFLIDSFCHIVPLIFICTYQSMFEKGSLQGRNDFQTGFGACLYQFSFTKR